MTITINGTTGITSPGGDLSVSQGLSGNLNFTGTGNRITGDFSNATIASRVMFQTSTANSSTSIYIIPNGTGTTSQFVAVNNSDPTNASILQLLALSTDVQLRSGLTGSGTYLPMTFYTGGSEKVKIDTSGNVGIGTATTTYRTNIVYTNSAGGVAETGLYLRNTSTGNSTQMLFDGYRSWSLLVQGSFGAPAGGFTIQDNTAGVNRLSINDSGSVSITQSPGQYTIDTTNGAASIANGGTVNFSNASGMLLVNNHFAGTITIYLCGAGLTSVVSALGTQVGTFAYNAGIAGYTWTNNYGSSAIFGFMFFRTRATA